MFQPAPAVALFDIGDGDRRRSLAAIGILRWRNAAGSRSATPAP
jgi:hypothetical protein